MVRTFLQGAFSGKKARDSSIPLSNIKRLFKSRFQVELSETSLGHCKLSGLLQDPRVCDLCVVQLKKHGYAVYPRRGAPMDTSALQQICMPQPQGELDAASTRSSCKALPTLLGRKEHRLECTQKAVATKATACDIWTQPLVSPDMMALVEAARAAKKPFLHIPEPAPMPVRRRRVASAELWVLSNCSPYS